MSKDASQKYIDALQSTAPEMNDCDVACAACGYNLRGLRADAKCPECGLHQVGSVEHLNWLIGGDEGERARWEAGVKFAQAVVIASAAAPCLHLVALLADPPVGVEIFLLLVLAVVAGCWGAAVRLVTPAAMDTAADWIRPARIAARVLPWLWVVGFVVMAMILTGDRGLQGTPSMVAMEMLVGFIPMIGVGCLLAILAFITLEADLEHLHARVNLVAWLFVPVGLVWVLFPARSEMPVFIKVPVGMVFPALLIGAWIYVHVMFWVSLNGLRMHHVWLMRHAQEAAGREERIAKKRAELQREADAQVRALPEHEGDVAFDDPNPDPRP